VSFEEVSKKSLNFSFSFDASRVRPTCILSHICIQRGIQVVKVPTVDFQPFFFFFFLENKIIFFFFIKTFYNRFYFFTTRMNQNRVSPHAHEPFSHIKHLANKNMTPEIEGEASARIYSHYIDAVVEKGLIFLGLLDFIQY
jgi:hypothetical protein